MAGRVLSVNVAEIRTIRWRGQDVATGIYKEPVEGPVRASGESLGGDRQVDWRVHGGDRKAVYAYAREDYEWWETMLEREFPPGMFGENLTLSGVDVTGADEGDRWRVGSALLEVTEPRQPCFKLGVKMGDPRFLKLFTAAGRPGMYLRIVEDGEIAAGDPVEVL